MEKVYGSNYGHGNQTWSYEWIGPSSALLTGNFSYSSGTTGMYPTSYLDGDGPMLIGAGKMSEMSSPDQQIGVPP